MVFPATTVGMDAPSPSQPSATGVHPTGHTDPIWYRSAAAPTYEPLQVDTEADVCIVGAGIAGLTTAYLLARQGKSVAVIDAQAVAGGESGRTSAHLSSAVDDRFMEIERVHGEAAARIQYESHAAAIGLIEHISHSEQIACGFKRLDAYLFPPDSNTKLLDDELAAAKRAGFADIERLDRCPAAGAVIGPCIRFGQQARFQPVQYLAGLARRLSAMGVAIYCGSHVTDMSTKNGVVTVTTAKGPKVTAGFGVAATNVPAPINNWAGIYTKIAPYRTYMVGLQAPKGSISDALYWDTPDPYHYARLETSTDPDHDVLIVGGADHKTGQVTPAEQPEHFAKVESWARRTFPGVGPLVSRWSGQVYEPDDSIAFIGAVPTSGHENCYVITGDSGMGLTHGTLGAMLVSDLILGKQNEWAALYDPARKKLKATSEFLKENFNAVAQYTDYVTPGEVSSPDEIPAGEGAILRRGLKKVAVYRDNDGVVHECSAVCTHLGGIVHWNSAEKSWDCPVHGSRFGCKGKVITGPAITGLSE